MKKNQGFIYVATTLDTKSAEVFYVSELIKSAGLAVRTVDLTTQKTQLEKKCRCQCKYCSKFSPSWCKRRILWR